MQTYLAYGLGIQSEIEIPEFIEQSPSIEQPHDVEVTICLAPQFRPQQFLPPEALEQRWCLQIDRESALVYVQDLALFKIEQGRQITIQAAPGQALEEVRFFLIGTVMAILLYQRGLLVLHGSAVNFQGSALTFLGISGEGKSSTVAAFERQGYGILADDIAAVDTSQKTLAIAAGAPQLKLGPESAAALGFDYARLAPLHRRADKRAYRFHRGFATAALPIRKLFSLVDGEEFSIRQLSAQASIMELTKHSRPTTLYHSGGGLHFLQCATLARQFPVYQLQRPRDLKQLPQLVQFVEAHLKETAAMSVLI